MRALDRRLRRLEVGLLPPPETAESRRIHEIVLDIRRRRAARLGLPEPEDVPEPDFPHGLSLAEMINYSWRRHCEEEAARASVDEEQRARS